MTPFLLAVLLMQAPAPAPKGWLRIQSQADVEVLWEGVSLGRTDATGMLLVEEIPPGTFHLELRAAGLEPQEHRITIEEGRNSLTAELAPVPVRARSSPRPERSAPAPPPAAAESEPETAAEPGTVVPASELPAAALEAEPTDVAATAPPAADAGGFGMGLLVALLATAGLAGGSLLYLRSRRPAIASPASYATAPPPSARSREEESTPAAEKTVTEAPDFLDQIRRREQQLDDRPAAAASTRSEEEVVIDVEYREVGEGDEP